MDIQGVNIIGGNFSGSPEVLYAFSTFTFTNANSYGNIGPTLSNCISTYNTVSNPWLTDTANFNMLRQGYQLWTVPSTGTYTIRVAGASAGYQPNAPYRYNQLTSGYCNGAVIEVGNVSLTKGDKLQIAVGQQGGTYANVSGGGGGASWVCMYTGNTNTAGDFIMVAGGGGAPNNANGNLLINTWRANSNASFGTLGNIAADPGGQGGNLTVVSGNTYPYTGGRNTTWTAGGSGWYANSPDSTQGASGGGGAQSFLNGLVGGHSAPGSYGNIYSGTYAAVGGFGGGGGTHGNSGGGGGGGGWTGGGGGTQNSATAVAGGGGSYSQLPATQIGYNRGQGYVIITKN